MSKLDFLVGRTVVEVRDDERVVFDAGAEPEPRFYADVGNAVCLDEGGEHLSLGDLAGRTVAQVSTERGALRIRFTGGSTLRSDPNPDNAHLPGRFRSSLRTKRSLTT
jgi:hypothetical protein